MGDVMYILLLSICSFCPVDQCSAGGVGIPPPPVVVLVLLS